jgi:phosphoglycolate phosphatase
VGFEAVGLTPPDRRTGLSIVGLSLDVAFKRLVAPEHAHLVPAMAEAYRQAKVERRLAGLDHDPLYPGARAVLDALHAREDVLLGVATGKALRGVRHMQEMHGLERMFVTIQTADSAPSKPHPGMILQAMAETGAQADRTVMIGDTTFDIDMARAAGVASVGVTWGYHSREMLVASGAGRIIDRFGELQGALAETLGLDLFAAERDIA